MIIISIIIQVTGIILSIDIVKWIISNELSYDIVDDVKLGIIIRDNFPQIKFLSLAKVSYNNFEEDSVFIRNKTEDRYSDLYRMGNIVTNFKTFL